MGPLPTDPAAIVRPSDDVRGQALAPAVDQGRGAGPRPGSRTSSPRPASRPPGDLRRHRADGLLGRKVAAAQAAFAIVDGKVAIVGDIASVKAAIDTNGSSPLASSDAFETATAALEGDALGFMFVDLRTILDSALTSPSRPRRHRPSTRRWSARTRVGGLRLRVEGDALVMDSAMPHVDGAHASGTEYLL